MKHEAWLLVAWGCFGAVHSLLATDSAKSLLRTPYYRLLYNAVALATAVPILLLLTKPPVSVAFVSVGGVAWGGYGATALGGWVIWRALSHYDTREFVGIDFKSPSPAALRIEGLSKSVRHPLYVGTLLVLWGIYLCSQGSSLALVNALCASGYIRIGIYFEERKLRRVFGDAYLTYQQSVPMLWPRWGAFFKNLI